MEIGLGAFIKFANASPRRRPRIAREITEQVRSEYDPATDFWRPVRQAISRDRKTSRDGEALRQLVLGAPPRRRPSFEEIRDRWGDVAARWDAAGYAHSTPTHVDVGGLQVRLNPLFSEQWGDGHMEAAHLYFNKEELRPETVQGIQHLLTRDTHPSEIEPVFIDMRRALTVPAVSFTDSMDDWLSGLGYEFRRLAA
ncbi:MAG: hypothetical protein QM611_11735 [Microbacterium sp.]|uniref:hypothetical protein n=1 Tax=Microbacterium sp. TaxID=51671 RepID=UPI0039E4E21A